MALYVRPYSKGNEITLKDGTTVIVSKYFQLADTSLEDHDIESPIVKVLRDKDLIEIKEGDKESGLIENGSG